MFADDDEGMPFFGADGALVTPGVEPLTAEGAEALAVRAGFAPASEDPAALLAIIRDALRRYVPGGGEQFLDRYLAAVAPQRATGPLARPLWQHGCGRIASGPGCTGPACRSCGEVGGWRALYVIDGGA